jgi:hypothetical protein
MASFDINKLKEIHKYKVNLKYKAFEHVLKICHTKINTVGKTGINHCWCLIPKLIWGYSIYDIVECGNYVKDKLLANGFVVEYYPPNILLISW